MRERKNQTFNAFIFRAFVLLNALFLFLPYVEQVAAEELTDVYEVPAHTETVSENIEDSDEEQMEEAVDAEEEEQPAAEAKQEALDERLQADDSEETVEDADAQLTDGEEIEDLSGEEAEADVEEQAESDAEDTEEKQDQAATEEETVSSEDALDSKETTDAEDALDLEDALDAEEETEAEEAAVLEEADSEETEEADAADETEEMSEEELAEHAEEDMEEMDEEEPETMTASAQRKQSKNEVEVNRIAGKNRYHNAVELSKSGWRSANTVILTNGENFADSLTGSPLAALHNAPILLTRANNLPNETLKEMKRLKPKEVIVLGGEASVSNAVLQTLQGNGFSTRRIGGRNRYTLAENIAKEVMAKEGKNRDAFLVSGEVFTDAMSIAPVAASKRLPIFLTRANTLHQTVRNAIPYVNSWTIIGGQRTINHNVQRDMENSGANTRRIDGKDRYEVNRNVIDFYGASGDRMYVASGEHFSDATPASVLAARKNSSVLLVNDNNKANLNEQRDFAKAKGTKELTLIGGPATLSKETEDYFHNQNYLIYLDPGHGGWESGAVGRVDGRTYYEKDINLEVAFKTRNLLLNEGYEVFMSRTDDTFVSLQRRPAQANNLGADIFVSLHHNAMPNSTTTTGIETFYYQPSSSYPPLAANRPYHNDPKRIEGSRQLAQAIHGELIDRTGAFDRGVKRGAYVVVREAHMPAVLLEYGFMSTPSDLRVFTQNGYQNNLAQATADGIIRYFA